jgi:hypothetical protein
LCFCRGLLLLLLLWTTISTRSSSNSDDRAGVETLYKAVWV